MQLCDKWLATYYGKLGMREFSLLDRAVRTLLGNILPDNEKKPLPWRPWRGISPSHIGFRGMWNWDTAFHAVGVSHWDIELAREQIRMFLHFQTQDGALPDVISETGKICDDYGKPPLIPWAALVIDQRCHDRQFVHDIYPALIKYEQFWMKQRGGAKDGLFHYDSSHADHDTRLTHAKWETGWDNAVRWDQGVFELWPVDLNCYMVMSYRALAYFAKVLGHDDDLIKWCQLEKNLAARIEEKLWDERSQRYLDYNFASESFVTALTPASFMPLYVGIASKKHAAAMAEYAADPHSFHPGWPTIAYDHPDFDPEGYWRGRTWLNVAYFALKGLNDYGYDKIAKPGRDTLLQWVNDNPDFIYENYHPLTGQGLGVRQFSWSAVFVIEFILNWE
jgi:putative isomerase